MTPPAEIASAAPSMGRHQRATVVGAGGVRATGTAAVRAAVLATRRSTSAPSELAVAGGFYLLVTLVLSQLWRAAAESGAGEVAGYGAVALVWYIAATEAAVASVPVRLIEEIGDDVTTRRIETDLLRPAPVAVIRLASEFGRIVPRLALSAGLGLVLATVLVGRPPSAVALLLAVPALTLAVAVNVALQHCFAALSFWVGEAKSGWFLYQKLVFVLGGMLLPLEVLPERLAAVARWLPFAATAYVPGRLASGHLEPWLLVVQVGWLVVAGVSATGLFAAGLHRMTGSGA